MKEDIKFLIERLKDKNDIEIMQRILRYELDRILKCDPGDYCAFDPKMILSFRSYLKKDLEEAEAIPDMRIERLMEFEVPRDWTNLGMIDCFIEVMKDYNIGKFSIVENNEDMWVSGKLNKSFPKSIEDDYYRFKGLLKLVSAEGLLLLTGDKKGTIEQKDLEILDSEDYKLGISWEKLLDDSGVLKLMNDSFVGNTFEVLNDKLKEIILKGDV